MIQNPQGKTPAPQSIWKLILKSLHLIHLILVALFVSYLLKTYPEVIDRSITFVMLIIYGYMIVWVFITNYLFLICKKVTWALIFDRIIVKFILIMFPLFGLLSYTHDTFLGNNKVEVFVTYMGIISALLLIYQVVCCTCLKENNPFFLFEQNDLTGPTNSIMASRTAYLQNLRNST